MIKNTLTLAVPPPPPQSPSEPAQAPAAPAAGKVSRKMLYAIIAIVVIVVAVVAGVLLLTGGGSINPNSINSAQSLKFTATFTGTGSPDFSYTFYAKNIGTNNVMIRVEGTYQGVNSVYIINGAQQKVWASVGDEWQELDWASNGESLSSSFNDVRSSLGSWTGNGDYTYSYQGGTVKVTSIQINPSLSDSLFTH